MFKKRYHLPLLVLLIVLFNKANCQLVHLETVSDKVSSYSVSSPILAFLNIDKYKIPKLSTEYQILEVPLQPSQFYRQIKKADINDSLFQILRARHIKNDSTIYFQGFVNQSIKLLVLFSNETTTGLIVDTDNDYDFTDETIISREYLNQITVNKIDSLEFITVTNLEYWDDKANIIITTEAKIIPNIKNVRIRSPYLKPQYTIEIISKTNFKSGILKIDTSNYFFHVNTRTSNNIYTEKESFLIITNRDSIFSNIDESDLFYINDTIFIGSDYYRIKDIDLKGSFINIEKLSSKKYIGTKNGFFAPTILRKSINQQKVINTSKINSDYILLDFGGTWCLPCLKTTPILKRSSNLFKEQNVEVIGISYDENDVKVLNYISLYNINWPIIFEKNGGQNYNKTLINKFSITSFPTFFLLNRNGMILKKGIGEEGLNKILSFLKSNKD